MIPSRRLALLVCAALLPVLACGEDAKAPDGPGKSKAQTSRTAKPDSTKPGGGKSAAGTKTAEQNPPRRKTATGKRLAGTYVLDRATLLEILTAKAMREDLPAGADEKEKKQLVDAVRQSAVHWHMQLVLAADQTFTAEQRTAPREPMRRLSGTWTLTGKKLELAIEKADDKAVADAAPMTATWEDGKIQFPEDEGYPFLLVRR